MMFKTPVMRLSIVLVLLTVNLLLLANWFGFVPNATKSAMVLRKTLSESLALQFSAAAETGEFKTIQHTLRAVVDRNGDIRSSAIRTHNGQLIAIAGEHLAHWKAPASGKSTLTYMQVPLFRNNQDWATMEICFAPLWTNKLADRLSNSFVGLLAFIALSGFLCYFFVIKRALRELDPSAVIPERVQKAFDILQEGVLILDNKEQIVMTNKSFADLFGKSPDKMVGLKGSELGWLDYQSSEQVKQLPWFKVLKNGQEQNGTLLSLLNHRGIKIKFVVNVAMVTDNAGKCRGVLVTFDDITQLEEKNFELNEMVEKLQLVKQDIQSKNEELKILSNYDPLTFCLNRRSLGEQFDARFIQAKASGSHLSCLMLDIDFFKTVNDRYGHMTGDQVIKMVADVLKTCTRDTDLVGRYGGEEFCVVLPEIYLDKAVQIAERIRKTIEKESCSGVKITVSLGVSSLEPNTNKPDDLINQADKSLYVAKKSGRNRVVTWGKDFNLVAEVDGRAEIQDQVSQSEKSTTVDTDQTKLQRRVMELEGLLKKRTQEMEHYEMYDFKTGLSTSSHFKDRIDHEIARGKRGDYLFVVLSMTIDTIKRVCETLGYSAAEQLVKACGQRLSDVLRENIDTVAIMENFKGTSTVSLINQTEFGILLTDIKQVDHVTWVMKRLLESFEKPFQVKGDKIYMSCYFGASIFPHDGQTADELYRSAANACSFAQKHNGKDRYLFSSQSQNEIMANQLKIESRLHEAVQNDELQLHYQPKVEAITGRITGFEALLRWQSAHLGSVPPDQFIPVAESSGQINRIGDWVFYNACRQLRSWIDIGLEVGTVAVNLSGIQLRQQNLASRIKDILEEFNIDSHLFEIELTESSFVNIYDQSFTILKQINDMGIRVIMDDFGTGYSSLSYLRNFPISALKIDKSFVSDIDKGENANQLVASIISIAHGLGLEVIAEGVEEKYQVDYLIALGCDSMQGYYFSRPVPQNEVADILHKQLMVVTG